MTGEEMIEARKELGEMWGYGRELTNTEMARVLRLAGDEPGKSVIDYERGKTVISGPISALVETYLRGVLPPDGLP